MAFHGFGTATRMFPPRTGTSNIFSPEYTGGIQKHGALLLHSWIQEAPLKGLAGVDFGIYIGNNAIASNGRQASKAPPPPPPQQQQKNISSKKPFLQSGSDAESFMIFDHNETVMIIQSLKVAK